MYLIGCQIRFSDRKGYSEGVTQFETYLIIVALLLIASVLSSKVASRFGIPALLIFLMIGVFSGGHVLDIVSFKSYSITQNLGVVALILILFSGGMNTEVKLSRPVLKAALTLSTLGVMISALAVGLFSKYFLNFSLLEGLLLGATVVSTDVAAVFTILRSKKVSLKMGIAPLLELESALNDPMAVFLGITLLDLIQNPEHSLWNLIPLFFEQMIFGLVFGYGLGWLAVLLINKIRLEFEGLYPVLSLSWIVFAYAITQHFGGSGFLAVYIIGILVGNKKVLHQKSLSHFHEGAAWLGQITMFLAMGVLIDPESLWRVAPAGIVLSLFLVFIARPVSVFLCFPITNFTVPEKLMISWAGLRGAVPIILGSYVLVSQIPKAKEIFNLVFFVTFLSVLLQGTTVPLIAKWLKVNLPFREKFKFPIEFSPTQDLRSKLIEIQVQKRSSACGKSLVQLNLPRNSLIVLIEREGEVLVPRGDTYLYEKDSLLVLSENIEAEKIRALFSTPS